MSDVMKTLGLTQLEKALPALFEQARQQKMTYETFLHRALDALGGGTQPACGSKADPGRTTSCHQDLGVL